MGRSIGHVDVVRPEGFKRLAYSDWGAPSSPDVLLCVHGLTRLGRDFDRIAGALEDAYRVVCPDMLGRGASDWLSDPIGYDNALYAGDMAPLLAKLDAGRLHWLGTSMGGIIGVLLAALPNTPIQKLVLNDIGPFVQKSALDRILDYLSVDWVFDDRAALEAHLRKAYAPFGDLGAAGWDFLTEISQRRLPDGRYGQHYDPKLVEPLKAADIGDLDFWALYDRIQCPVLVLRGAESDLLLQETAEEMTRRGPKAELAVIEGCGHAPALMDPAQIALVRDWLLR